METPGPDSSPIETDYGKPASAAGRSMRSWLCTPEGWTFAPRRPPARSAPSVLELSRAASSSPARIAPEDIAAATRHLTPSAIVELIVWISVMQLLHRLHTFYQ